MLSSDIKEPVVILGAGIVGICTALSLLERGVPVTLIDRGDPGQETSMGNAGVVSPWSIVPQAMPGIWKTIPNLMFGYGRPLSIHPKKALKMIPWGMRFLRQGREESVVEAADAMSLLCGPSIELYEQHLRGTGHENLITQSCYVHAFRDASRARLDDLGYRLRSRMGADLELVGRDQLATLEPALSPTFQADIVINGQARVRSPGRLGKVLVDKAKSLGATFKRAVIKKLSRTQASWVISCENEEIEAHRVVMCLGVWSADMLRELPLKMPLIAERGYHAEFHDPGIEINNSVMDVDAKIVASSMEDGVRIAGQAEFAPIDAQPSQKRKALLVDVAKKAFPHLRTASPNFWMGRRPSFPDSLPMLGGVQDQPGLYANFGHSHYGLMMAPKSGKLVAEIISGNVPNANLEPFSPTRF